MSMWLRNLSTECVVARRLSLSCNRQGYLVSYSISLVRQNPISTVCSHILSAINHRGKGNLSWNRTAAIRRDMGHLLSKGKKYNPHKHSSGIDTSVEHAKFASGGKQQVKNDDVVEGVLCKEEELEENQMKVFELGENGGKVLLVKQNGKISALGPKCTHYGAPLEKGALGEGRIRCQWHGACFNIATGDIEDFPGLDSLPCYEVILHNGNVTVRAQKKLLESNKRVKAYSKRIESDPQVFVVVGGGPAGANCVETLRQNGFTGRLVLVTAEPYLPYDRIKLSKALDVDVNKITLRPADFYKERDIEVMLSTELTAINPQDKTIELSDQSEMKYDKIFLATGSSPRKMFSLGSDLSNIFVLRNVDDAKNIKESLKEQSNVVIIGSSFIGLEAASLILGQVASVTVVAIERIPFELILGADVGRRIRQMFEEKGVHFHMEQSVTEFHGEDGVLKNVELKDGTKLVADVCLIGIGVVPNTNYLAEVGIELEKNGTIRVNEFLETELPNVFAGGDIAFAPVLGHKAAIGHWGLANYHGHIAALNMLGKKKQLKAVPFFWTVLFGKGFRYTGFAPRFDDVVIEGDVNDLQFIAYYCQGEVVQAVLTVNRDPVAANFAELLHQGKKLLKAKISYFAP